MSVFHDFNIRPYLKEYDHDVLERWRHEYTEATLSIPKGYSSYGVETAIAERMGRRVGSLTATSAVIIDPYIHDPAVSGVEGFLSVYGLDRTLCYNAMKARTGATVAYTSVPKHLTAYHEILRKSGYELVAQDCYIFRRPLIPDLT